MPEIWKTSVTCDNYEISNMGRVRSKKTGLRKLKIMGNSSHQTVTLLRDSKSYSVTVGREVLSTFQRPPTGNEKCFHLDLDPLNDRLENLEWREYIGPTKKVEHIKSRQVVVVHNNTGEQTKYESAFKAAEDMGVKRAEIYDSMRGKRVSKLDSFTFKYNIPSVNEVDIRTIRMGDHVIEVTSEGLVRADSSKDWRQGRVHDSGYYLLTFQFDKEGNNKDSCGHYVHHLVAEAFHGPRPNGYVVDHKDENKLNNHATNLQYISRSENQKKSFVVGNSKAPGMKKIDQFDLDGSFIKTHVSMSEAAREVKLKGPEGISFCCSNKYKSAGGFVWRFHGQDFDQEHRPIKKARKEGPRKTKAKAVYAYNKTTLAFVKQWPSALAASAETGCAPGNISRVINGGSKQTGGYIFSLLDEEAFKKEHGL